MKIAALGGGHGLANLLTGLRGISSPDVTVAGIVTVSDNGGSSGRIAREHPFLPPPGDIRNCLTALAGNHPVAHAFEVRFPGEGPLGGHVVGNLVLAALTLKNGGDMALAASEIARALAVGVSIYPSSDAPLTLCAECLDGAVYRGETEIRGRARRSPIRRVWIESSVPEKPVSAHANAVAALADADLIVLGPGSLYTSLIPNLLLPEIREAIRLSPARKVYVANLMTEPGETDGMGVADHVRAVILHGRFPLDAVVVSTTVLDDDEALPYNRTGAAPIRFRRPYDDMFSAGSPIVVTEDLAEVVSPGRDGRNVVRHRPEALARVLDGLAPPSYGEGVLNGRTGRSA